ncbi:GNAT family N-acetyltransferase [Streptomyces sp. NPDC004111]|uniref:GNAT family N-acetyltransferase n=1 Tax=Streptomyces sp. NPDC004111 TaxID=3364690 RepID=UPI00368991AB
MTTTEPTVSADGLTLRPWRAADAAGLTALCRASDMSTVSIEVATEADARRWLADQRRAWATGTRLSFAVTADAVTADAVTADGTGEVVGQVVLKGLAPGGTTAEVGYWTAGPQRGRGVATRAVSALARWAFATYGANGLVRLELFHAVANTGSCRVAEKAGFAFVRELPPHPLHDNKGHLHALTRG